MLPQQTGADDMFDGPLVELRSYDGSVKLILLQVSRKNWKFEEDSSQKRGVCCSGAQYGRGGQTAMAMALSNEKEIKDVLNNMIVFIIGLESSNLRVILETIPDKIILRKRLEFQNVEEAHRQLEQ